MNSDERNFETHWQKSDSESPWRIPDDEVSGLIIRLRKESASRVLDLGFGLGRHVVLFARERFKTYGIEPTESGFQHCTDWLKAEGLEADIGQGHMLQLPFPDSMFDFVISFNVVYHGTLADMETALQEINRVLRKSGLLYLTLNSTRNHWYGKGNELEHNTFVNPEKGDGDHKHHYSDRREVERILSGWELEMIRESELTLAGKTYPGSWHWMILARQ